MLKQITSLVIHNPAFARFVDLLEGVDEARPNLLRVLTYHRVDEPNAHPELFPGIVVTPEMFERQIRFLAANYDPISMLDLLDACCTGAPLPQRAVLVTFDDAYCDFAENTWPILRRFHVPVTLFVPTVYPDHLERIFWWDWLYAALHFTCRRDELITPLGRFSLSTQSQRDLAFYRLQGYVKTLPHTEAMAWVEQTCEELGVPKPEQFVMGWDQLRQLAKEGVILGAHTQTHLILDCILTEEVRAEVLGSREDLRREIGSVLPIFAYPGGKFNEQVVRVLEEEGFILGFTTKRGINDFGKADRLRLRRINVGLRTTLAVLRAQLLTRSMLIFR